MTEMHRMDIAIVGAGVAGSTLYRMIHRAGWHRGTLDLYGIREEHPCGIHPCAWMTHGRMCRETLEGMGMEADRYLLQGFSQVHFDGYPIGCDLAILHKPRLLRDLRENAPVRYDAVDPDAYDVVADCTGRARALLPLPARDLVIPTLQYRIRRAHPGVGDSIPRIRFVRQGYAWAFPLGNGHVHVGVGSFVEDLGDALTRVGFLRDDDVTICSCTSAVRLGATTGSLPFHAGNVWGVGESIGTVSPLVGDGILPSMRCASLFTRLLRDGTMERYEEQVRAEFAWMDEERRVVERMIGRNGQVTLGDLFLMREHADRFGMRVGLRWILSWILGRRILGRFP